jgi:hypothetical protein
LLPAPIIFHGGLRGGVVAAEMASVKTLPVIFADLNFFADWQRFG